MSSSGSLSIVNSSIQGNSAGNGGNGHWNDFPFFVDGNGANGGYGGGVFGNADSVSIVNSAISGNSAGNGGSGDGVLPASGDGGAGGDGGGLNMFVNVATITNSTIAGNSAGNGGIGTESSNNGGNGGHDGGVQIYATIGTIANSTIVGNTAGNGGSGGNEGGLGGSAGGLFVSTGAIDVGSFVLANDTVSDNNAGAGPGGAGVGGGVIIGTEVLATNSVVANNISGGNCFVDSFFPFEPGSTHNIASDATCASSFTQKTPAEINLGFLDDNGGSTLTMALLSPSAAIDAGDNAACAAAPVNNLDQRGVTRPLDGDGNTTAVCDIGAFEVPEFQGGPTFIVNSTASNDDGACHFAPGGDCTLREAIDAANADGVASTVEFGSAATYTLNEVDNSANGLPVIASDITINGNGSTIARDPGAPAFRILQVSTTGMLALDEVTVTGGLASGATGNGGGISVGAGVLAVMNSAISGNTAAEGAFGPNGQPGKNGGGIYVTSGSAVIINSTISGNNAGLGGSASNGDGGDGGHGGGIAVLGGTLTMSNSTISGNHAGDGAFGGRFGGGGNGGEGGGIYLNATASAGISNSTISGNSAGNGGESDNLAGTGGNGGGVHTLSGGLTLTNTTLSGNAVGVGGFGAANGLGGGISAAAAIVARNIIAANSSGGDCASSFAAGSTNNMATDGTCGGFTQKTTGEINLGPLADNGGPTLTMALLVPSAAIDTGDDTICASDPVNNLDQRGVARPLDGDGNGTVVCDIGAYEAPDLDDDDDGVLDSSDNCPAWPNPTQTLPPWPVPAGDSDCDGFTNAAEGTLGTDPVDQCPDNASDDAWPPDIDMSGAVSVTDVLFLKPFFGLAVPPAPARLDLVPSAPPTAINITDVVEFKKYFGSSCT